LHCHDVQSSSKILCVSSARWQSEPKPEVQKINQFQS
jgi:hypothetical protein